MTNQKLRPIMVGEPFEHEGETVITGQVTLSLEDWMLLVENQTVSMFQANTLRNRIKSLLFWSLQVEAGNLSWLQNADWAEIERQAMNRSPLPPDAVDEDVPF
jgi:hypothetical protein